MYEDKSQDGKVSKEKARFEHPAKGMNHCSQCVHYNGSKSKTCEIVAGKDIMPSDWCKYFRKKKA